MQPGSGLNRGEVPEVGVFAEPGAVVFDLDEAKYVSAGGLAAVPDGGADLRFEQSEEALGCGVIVAYAGSSHALPQVQLPYLAAEFATRVLAPAVSVHDAAGLQTAA